MRNSLSEGSTKNPMNLKNVVKNSKYFGKDNGKPYVTSNWIAKVIHKRPANVKRDIDCYYRVLKANSILSSAQFFKKGHYRDSNNQLRSNYKCFLKGCEMYANKMTGTKGVIFSAEYINKFHQMKNIIDYNNKPSYEIEDPIERAHQWITEQEQKEQLRKSNAQLELSNQQMKPYADTTKSMIVNHTDISVKALSDQLRQNGCTQLSKNYRNSHGIIYRYLKHIGLLTKRSKPTQKALNEGLLESEVEKFTVKKPDGTKTTKTGIKPMVTVKLLAIMLNHHCGFHINISQFNDDEPRQLKYGNHSNNSSTINELANKLFKLNHKLASKKKQLTKFQCNQYAQVLLDYVHGEDKLKALCKQANLRSGKATLFLELMHLKKQRQ